VQSAGLIAESYRGVSDYVLVRIQTDGGVEGVGEATVTPRWSGETVWGATARVLVQLCSVVLGLPFDQA